MFLVLIMSLVAETTIADITGETITGMQTSRPTNVSLFINPAIPTLTILSPQNATYLKNYSILLDFISTLADNLWYNFDNGENSTIESALYFNISEGSHTLFMYANNSQGTTIKNVTFAVNSTFFIIYYEEYKGTSRGESTEFINYTYEAIQNLENIVLENTLFGKIFFNEVINLTNDADSTDGISDLDSNTNISFNRIEIDTTELSNFEKSAKIWLYNLTFSNPRILRDGSVCSSSICTNSEYDSETGVLSFNVSSFTVYSAEETPSYVPLAIISGGGGAGARVVKEILLSREVIKVELKQGQRKTEEIVIRNTGNAEINIRLDNLFEEFLEIDEQAFYLKPNEFKTINLEFFAKSSAVPNVYVGKLVINAEGTSKEVLILLEVESKETLFDISLLLDSKFSEVYQGDSMQAIIFVNTTEKQVKDVNFEYIIKNFNNEIIFSEQETIPIKGISEFNKVFEAPTEKGMYVLYVKASYEDKSSISSFPFNVKEKYPSNETVILVALSILLVFIVLAIIFIRLRHVKVRRAAIPTKAKVKGKKIKNKR